MHLAIVRAVATLGSAMGRKMLLDGIEVRERLADIFGEDDPSAQGCRLDLEIRRIS